MARGASGDDRLIRPWRRPSRQVGPHGIGGVFALNVMYAACSFVVGTVAGVPAITDFAKVWVWVALAVWLVVAGAMLRRAPGLVRGAAPLPGASG